MYDAAAEQRDAVSARYVKYIQVPKYLCDIDDKEYHDAARTWRVMTDAVRASVRKSIEEGRHVRR